MRVLFVTSEVFPLAKTGGLADVSASLPAALIGLGADVRLMMPAYPQAVERATHIQPTRHLGQIAGKFETRLLSARLPDSGIPIWLVDCPGLFERPGGPYQDSSGLDWVDNAQRFAVLDHAALTVARGASEDGWVPDLLHGNDWHAGLIPLLLAADRRPRPRSVLTIHNLGYQGLFPLEIAKSLCLPNSPGALHAGEFYGRFSFLKAGISCADALTTVSPTYASEILTSELGFGLEGVLRARSGRLHGILNGADYGVWDPRHDPHLARNYSARDLSGKRVNKAILQRDLGLDISEDAPLIAWMSRLVNQKMPDIALDGLPALLDEGAQFVLVAEGDPSYEAGFRDLALRYPRQVAAQIGYQEPMAHRLLAAADMLLHPARYEPCGLSPIYAMRYGAVPIVRRCGGLADSVVDATSESLHENHATGFSFEEPTAAALVSTVRRAVSLFNLPLAWRKIQANAMRQDFSWQRSAETYLAVYGHVLGIGEARKQKPRRKITRLSA